MNLDRYEYTANKAFLNFEFFSEGPNGKIKKVIRFSPQNANGITYFHLGFGDRSEETGVVDDQSVTNNLDKSKILATVAATVLEFTSHFPDIMVYAKGSTQSRTRLYQMGIASNWHEIQSLLHVFGFVNDNWQPFAKNVNYEAFLVRRKKL